MAFRTRITDQFELIADNGRRFPVMEETRMILAPTHDGPSDEVPGSKTLRTAEGMDVSVEHDATYLIKQLGLRARRADR